MKLIIIRHGDPDYKTDTLTEKGRREAELLSETMQHVEAAAVYVSSMGRAAETAAFTLEKTGQQAVTCEWLREFLVDTWRPHDKERQSNIPWDWMPADWTAREAFFSKDSWYTEKEFRENAIKDRYDAVCAGLDGMLADHGYERDGYLYRAVRPSHDTIVLFCHFGLEAVVLSHLLNISPVVMWQGFCTRTTGVTTLVTEERQQGIACFRLLTYGDVSHLTGNGEEPSFMARFCECWTDDTRH